MTKNLLSRSALIVSMLFCGLSFAVAGDMLPAIEGIEIAQYKGIYDGKAHSITVTGMQSKDSISYSLDGVNWTAENPLFTDASEQKVFVKVDRVGCSSFVGADSVIITRRSVKVVSKDATKIYDGTPLTYGVVSVTGDGFLNKECPRFNVTGTQTDVGSSANVFDMKFNEKYYKAENYDIEKIEGTLTVTYISKDTIKVAAIDVNKVYDGKPLYAQYTFTDDVLLDSDTLKVTFDTDENPITNVGSQIATITGIKVLRGEEQEDFTQGYIILCTVPSDTLTVDTCNITLKTYDATKVYDGTPLTRTKLTIDGQFAEGEGFVIKVVGTQTKVGSSVNKCKITANKGTDISNYNFIEDYGTLQVTLSLKPVFVSMYNNSNFVLEASDFTSRLNAVSGVTFTLQSSNIEWYKMSDSGTFVQCGTGFYYTQTDGSSMSGAYYVIVTVPEVESKLGIKSFSSDVVEFENSAEGQTQLKAYSISGKPVGEDYHGIVIYENGFKTIK